MQCLGASGACHMGAAFLRQHYGPYKSNPNGNVYLPSETWGESFCFSSHGKLEFLCRQTSDFVSIC